MKQVQVPVISCSEVMPGVYQLWFESSQIAIEARPGKFLNIRCGDDVLLRRPLSIHNIDGDKVAVLFAVAGQGTQWLSERKIGDVLDILGPLGNGIKVGRGVQDLLLVAGGIGIAPLVFVAQKAVADGISVKLIHGAVTGTHLYPDSIDGAEIIYVTDDGSAGEKGVVTDFLPDLLPLADQVIACGPIPMYRAMERLADKFDGKPVQVLMEQVMACGVGACRGCSIPTINGQKMVCQDGPVFDLMEINWDQVKAPK